MTQRDGWQKSRWSVVLVGLAFVPTLACSGAWLQTPRVEPPRALAPGPSGPAAGSPAVLLESGVAGAVRVARGHVALARAEHVADEGILPLVSADRIAMAAFESAATEAQQVRGELLVAGADLRAIATGGGWGAEPERSGAPTEARVAVVHGTGQRTVRTEDARAQEREVRSVDASRTQREVATIRVPDGSPTTTEQRAAATTGERWLIPVREPRVTSRFGPRIDPITGAPGRMHRGIDYGHPTGTPVLATASGTVLLAGWCDSGTGNCVVIEHSNGWRSQYFHLSAVHARAGGRVEQGEVIGEIGSTGRSTGPHLHFQIGPPGGALDPEPLFGTRVQ